MSRNEDWLVDLFWEEVGGTLIREYIMVPNSKSSSIRKADAVIIRDTKKIEEKNTEKSVENRDIYVVQAKNSNLGMSVMGQALFSLELMREKKPHSIKSVILCSGGDEKLEKLLDAHKDIELRIYHRDNSYPWKWRIGKVNKNDEHLEIIIQIAGESLPITIAKISKPNRKVFSVEFERNEAIPSIESLIERCKKTINYYLIELHEHDPWAYA
jgi:hypothetical protein